MRPIVHVEVSPSCSAVLSHLSDLSPTRCAVSKQQIELARFVQFPYTYVYLSKRQTVVRENDIGDRMRVLINSFQLTCP